MLNSARSNEMKKVIGELLECSLFVTPTAIGLLRTEMIEAGKRLGYQAGEWGDALQNAGHLFEYASQRYEPESDPHRLALWIKLEPDWRNPDAFILVYEELMSLSREHGVGRCEIPREVLLSRAEAAGLPRIDMEATLRVLLMERQLTEQDGILRADRLYLSQNSPMEQMKSRSTLFQPSRFRERIKPLVEDLVSRRTDGRPAQIDALDAFSACLEQLQLGTFRRWWVQMRTELSQTNPMTSPVSAAVLAAALMEGALTFVVRHARDKGLRVLGSKAFDEPPHTWKIDELIKSAMQGGADAILDAQAGSTALRLAKLRQRIHAGRMLSEHPAGVTDLRPEEAREALLIAERTVRAVLDWLERVSGIA